MENSTVKRSNNKSRLRQIISSYGMVLVLIALFVIFSITAEFPDDDKYI